MMVIIVLNVSIGKGVVEFDLYCVVRGSENVFQLHELQCKIDTASAQKILLCSARSNQPC